MAFIVSLQSADHLAVGNLVNIVLNSLKLMTGEAQGIQRRNDAAAGKSESKTIYLLDMHLCNAYFAY